MLRLLSRSFLKCASLNKTYQVSSLAFYQVCWFSTSFEQISNKAQEIRQLELMQGINEVLVQAVELNFEKDANKIIMKYPYLHIPMSAVLNFHELKIEEELKKDLVGLKIIHYTKFQYNKDLCLKALNILFPDESDFNKPFTKQTARELSQRYFDHRAPQLIQQIYSANPQFKQYALSLLLSMPKTQKAKQAIQNLNKVDLLQNDNQGLALAYYVGLMISINTKNGLPLNELLAAISDLNFNRNYQACQKIAKVIFCIPNFYQHFSQTIIQVAVKAIIARIPDLSLNELDEYLTFLFGYICQQTTELAKVLTEKVLKDKHHLNCRFIIKLMNFRRSISMGNNNQFGKIFEANPKILKSHFSNPVSNKEHILTILFEHNTFEQNDELMQIVNHFVEDLIQSYTRIREVEEITIIRHIKLMAKCYKFLIPRLRTQMIQTLQTHILPNFKQSKQCSFLSLVIIARYLNDADKESESRNDHRKYQMKIKENRAVDSKAFLRLIETCLSHYCSIDDNDDFLVERQVCKVMEIIYMAGKLNYLGHLERVPKIFCFRNKTVKDTLKIKSFQHYLRILKIVNAPDKEKINSLYLFQQQISNFFKERLIRKFYLIYSFLHSISLLKFESALIFQNLEHNWFRLLQNEIYYHKEFIVPKEDFIFLKTKIVDLGYGSASFKLFVNRSIENYAQVQQFQQDYIQQRLKFQKTQESPKDKRLRRTTPSNVA